MNTQNLRGILWLIIVTAYGVAHGVDQSIASLGLGENALSQRLRDIASIRVVLH